MMMRVRKEKKKDEIDDNGRKRRKETNRDENARKRRAKEQQRGEKSVTASPDKTLTVCSC